MNVKSTFLMSMYFCKLSQHSKDLKLLNDGCYDDQPNQCVIDPVIVDVTQTKIAMSAHRAFI